MIVGLLEEILEQRFLVESILVIINVDFVWYHNRHNTVSSQGRSVGGKEGKGHMM